MELITHEFIKKTVQEVSGIKDLSECKRDKEYPLTRYVAFRLSRDYLPKQINTLESIAKCYGLKNHATVLTGINKFNEFKKQPFFKPYLKVYQLSNMVINNHIKGILDDIIKVSDFNKSNTDQELKESIDKILNFINNFYVFN